MSIIQWLAISLFRPDILVLSLFYAIKEFYGFHKISAPTYFSLAKIRFYAELNGRINKALERTP